MQREADGRALTGQEPPVGARAEPGAKAQEHARGHDLGEDGGPEDRDSAEGNPVGHRPCHEHRRNEDPEHDSDDGARLHLVPAAGETRSSTTVFHSWQWGQRPSMSSVR